jgi:RNA recognition motif-containing protein
LNKYYFFLLYLDDQFKQHLEGKKHKKIESIKHERERSAQCSVFVSNLKKDTFQKHLEENFNQFGKISKVVIDQEKV